MKKIFFAIFVILFLSGCGEQQNPINMVNVSIQVFTPEEDLSLIKEVSVPKNSTALSILEKNINIKISDSTIISVEGMVLDDEMISDDEMNLDEEMISDEEKFIVLYINDSQTQNLNQPIVMDSVLELRFEESIAQEPAS